MATVPTPLDATAGAKATASAVDAGVKLPLDWLLTGFPKCHVSVATTGISIPNTSTLTLISWNTEAYDTDNMHDNSTNPSRVIYNTTGYYEVDYWVSTAAAAASDVQMRVTLNGAGAAGGGTALRTQQYSDGVRFSGNISFRFTRLFTAGDYTELFVQSNVALTTSTTGLGTRCFARWISN